MIYLRAGGRGGGEKPAGSKKNRMKRKTDASRVRSGPTGWLGYAVPYFIPRVPNRPTIYIYMCVCRAGLFSTRVVEWLFNTHGGAMADSGEFNRMEKLRCLSFGGVKSQYKVY